MKKSVYNYLSENQVEVDKFSELALDLRWSWDHSADEIWKQLDPQLWNSTHSPWIVLQTVSNDRFQSVINDPLFRKKIDFLLKSMKESNAAPAWFQKQHPNSSLTCVAYLDRKSVV